VYDINSEGEEKLLLILGPGDVYPLIWSFGESDRLLYFYEAMTETKIEVANRQQLQACIDENHELTKDLLRYFVNRSKDLMLRIECLESSNAQYKIAQVLQYLVSTYPGKVSKQCTEITVPITHQHIANMAGLSRETASIHIKELEVKNMLSQSSAALSVNTQKLEKFISSE
jgi:CRP/FNR family transcriptional regulator